MLLGLTQKLKKQFFKVSSALPSIWASFHKTRINADVNLVKEVYRQMDQANCGSVLLIFDNAMKLSSAADEPGILDFLPTDSLPNGRFPYIIITTQTQDWGLHIKTFQVGGLREGASLAFYQSSFRVQSWECTEEFKKLHVLLEGYPLIMNLAVSQIDFDPDRDSVDRLKQQLIMYINVFEEKQKELLHEIVDAARGNRYDKTLSTVWEITCERLVKYPNGPEALEVVQILSFLKLPIDLQAVERIFSVDSEDANLTMEECKLRLKELIRVLDKFHIARILQKTDGRMDQSGNWYLAVRHRLHQLGKRRAADNGEVREHGNNIKGLEVGIHRLIQLVVRQETDCSKIIERVLCYLAHLDDFKSEGGVNTALLFAEIAQKNELSVRALTYLGLLTCQGSPQACEVFKAIEPKTEVAVTLWSCYNCIRGDSTCVESVDEVLRKLRLLLTSHESLRDRQLFADIMFKVLLANYPNLVESLRGVEEFQTNSILKECSIDDLKPRFVDGDREELYKKLRGIYAWVLKAFVQSDAFHPPNAVGRLAQSWLAISGRLKCYDPSDFHRRHAYLVDFWREMYDIIDSPDCFQLKIVELVRCLWDRGIGKTLIEAFAFLEIEFYPSDMEALLKCFEVCLNGMQLKDKRVQAVVLAFFDHFANIVSSNEDLPVRKRLGVLYPCTLCVKLLLMDDEPPSQKLLQSWSRIVARPWIKKAIEVELNKIISDIPIKYYTDYFPQFILKKSSSEDPEIQRLVHICRQMMEPFKKGVWIACKAIRASK